MLFHWCHGDESPVEDNTYDMIMGRDLLHELGIVMDFSKATVTWDNAWINIQGPGLFKEMDLDDLKDEIELGVVCYNNS